MLNIPTVSNLKTLPWEIASGVLEMWKWNAYSLIKRAATLFFNNVRRYVPIYLVSKNEIILTKHFWHAYTDGRTDGRTGRQLITIKRLRRRVYKIEIVSAYAANRNETYACSRILAPVILRIPHLYAYVFCYWNCKSTTKGLLVWSHHLHFYFL